MKKHQIHLPRREVLMRGGAGVLGLIIAAATRNVAGAQTPSAENVMANLKKLTMGDFNPNYATQWSYRLANALGYSSTVVMPITQSKEKIDSLELLGADLHLVGATSYSDPKHYIHTAQRLAQKMADREENGAVWARQFDNLANMEMHERTTGREIWEQTDGKLDGFICAVGTGGTLAGVSTALKARNQDITIGLADPAGASLYDYFSNGTLEATPGNSIIEGIGINHVTDNVAQAKVDVAFSISDEEALPYIFDLLRNEGLCMGGSAAVNIAGAVRLAEHLGPGHTIVTILCDYGNRYQSKLFNPVFLENKGLPVPEWLVI